MVNTRVFHLPLPDPVQAESWSPQLFLLAEYAVVSNRQAYEFKKLIQKSDGQNLYKSRDNETEVVMVLLGFIQYYCVADLAQMPSIW